LNQKLKLKPIEYTVVKSLVSPEPSLNSLPKNVVEKAIEPIQSKSQKLDENSAPNQPELAHKQEEILIPEKEPLRQFSESLPKKQAQDLHKVMIKLTLEKAKKY
jgi:hypothetical protein